MFTSFIDKFKTSGFSIPIFYVLITILSATAIQISPTLAQVINAPNSVSTSLSTSVTQIAQVTAPPQFVPTDVTPFTVSPERNSFNPGYKFRIFQALPERLWFNSTTEVSQRLDTNVLFTYSHPKADYAFRALPNLTIGYDIFKNTAVYVNYFVIKDVFARDYNNITAPTTQSLSWGIRHNIQMGQKSNLQLDFQARELWQASHLHQFDFLPGMTLTHTITPNNVVYGSTLLQMRGKDYFVAPTRELDPFYTLGYMYRHGSWTFSATDTLVTNFRSPPFSGSIPQYGNGSMIADFEVNRPVLKQLPSLLAFVRAEPIWNWDSHKEAGISGFDFRLFTGLRLSMNKPSYYGQMDDMRQQIIKSEESTNDSTTNSTNNSPSSVNPPNNSNTGTPNTQSGPTLRGY